MNVVLLRDLAPEFGTDRSNLRKWLTKEGFRLYSVRAPGTRGQPTLAVSEEDAETARARRSAQGYIKENRAGVSAATDCGFFYMIQLVPEAIPNRVKLGFTSNVATRLQEHRTAAPTARLVKAWPCRRPWECAAIASITSYGCDALSTEVYEGPLGLLVARGDAFFSLMPAQPGEPEGKGVRSDERIIFLMAREKTENMSPDDSRSIEDLAQELVAQLSLNR